MNISLDDEVQMITLFGKADRVTQIIGEIEHRKQFWERLGKGAATTNLGIRVVAHNYRFLTR